MNNNPWQEQPKSAFPIHACSPQAMSRIDATSVGSGETEAMKGRTKYPYCMLKIGECFTVPVSAGIQRSVLECGWRQYGARTNKRFVVIQHGSLGLIEVARIA